MPRSTTTAGTTCLEEETAAAQAADDSLDATQAGAAAVILCLPESAAGQCTVADFEAMIDGDDSTAASEACKFAPTNAVASTDLLTKTNYN